MMIMNMDDRRRIIAAIDEEVSGLHCKARKIAAAKMPEELQGEPFETLGSIAKGFGADPAHVSMRYEYGPRWLKMVIRPSEFEAVAWLTVDLIISERTEVNARWSRREYDDQGNRLCLRQMIGGLVCFRDLLRRYNAKDNIIAFPRRAG